jgi:hypothetical protein
MAGMADSEGGELKEEKGRPSNLLSLLIYL